MDPHRVAIVAGAIVIGVVVVGLLVSWPIVVARRRRGRRVQSMTVGQAVELGARLNVDDRCPNLEVTAPVEGRGVVDVRKLADDHLRPVLHGWTTLMLDVRTWSPHRATVTKQPRSGAWKADCLCGARGTFVAWRYAFGWSVAHVAEGRRRHRPAADLVGRDAPAVSLEAR